MTSRERWIVYPLLFLTLGIAMRDKIIPPTRLEAFSVDSQLVDCVQLDCQSINLVGADGKSRIRMGEIPGRSGRIEVYDARENRVVEIGADASGKNGEITTRTPLGMQRERIPIEALVERHLMKMFQPVVNAELRDAKPKDESETPEVE